jgi:hypothetical protein
VVLALPLKWSQVCRCLAGLACQRRHDSGEE